MTEYLLCKNDSIVSGFGYDEDKHYFTWNEDSKRQSADDILDKGVIPVIKQQGLISKLGMYTNETPID